MVNNMVKDESYYREKNRQERNRNLNKKNGKNKKEKKKSKNRNKNNLKTLIILFAGIVIIFSIIMFIILKLISRSANEEKIETEKIAQIHEESKKEDNVIEVVLEPKNKIDDWRLILVNSRNPLPEDSKEPELVYVEGKQFDKRAAGELQEMMKAMKKDGITNIWIQSTYRSIEYQKQLYDNKINEYLSKGATKEQAEALTIEYINRPGESEHNLGLAVDFNNVDDDFENTKAYNWLSVNAKDYGFVMRYPEEKAEITGIAYEPWHWRYVGKEHSYKMEELDMCLEEYIEYLENGGEI